MSLAFIALTIIHLILAWSWVKAQSCRMFKDRVPLIIGLTVVVSILTIFIFWTSMPKNSPLYSNYERKNAEFERRGITETHPAESPNKSSAASASEPQKIKSLKSDGYPKNSIKTTPIYPAQEETQKHEAKTIHGRSEEDSAKKTKKKTWFFSSRFKRSRFSRNGKKQK